MKKRVVAYCRVSTSSKDQTNSFENQKAFFEREVEKNPDYELVGIYADKGVSGTKLQRPEFDRMLTDAGLDIIEVTNEDNDERKEYKEYTFARSSSRTPKFDIILTKNTSRFARNVEVSSILRKLRENHVYVHFLDLNKTTQNTDDITYIQIFQSFDERDSRDKSKKVLFGKAEGYRKGTVNTNSKIYGYNYIQSENRLEIVEHEAIIIRKIFELYADGLGARRILSYLNENQMFTRQGKPFAITTIRNMLDNEKYAGLNPINKYDLGLVFNKNSYAKVRDEYKVVKSDRIPAIVSQELFYKCREIKHGKINYQKSVGVYTGISKYSQIIRCGKCKEVYWSNADNGRQFYVCKNKKKHGIKVCNSRNISQKYIDDYLQEMFKSKSYLDNNRFMKDVVVKMAYEVFFTLVDQYDNDKSDQIAEIDTQIKGLNQQIESVIGLISMGGAVANTVQSKLESINQQISELQEQKANLSVGNDTIVQHLDKIYSEIILPVKTYSDKVYTTIDEMIDDINEITVYDDDLMVTFKDNIPMLMPYLEQIKKLNQNKEHNILGITEEGIAKYMDKYNKIKTT